MTIKELKSMDDGVSGVAVEAQVLNSYAPREIKGQYGTFKSQNVQLVDGEDKMYVGIVKDFVNKEDIGKKIAVTNCKVGSYKGEKQLSATKSSEVKMERTAKVGQESITPHKSYGDMVTEALDEVGTVVSNPVMTKLMEVAKEKGFTSEDVRAMFISRMIEKAKKY